MVKFSDLSKEAQRRVHANKFAITYAKRRGQAGWVLRFVSRKNEAAKKRLEVLGYEKVQNE